MTIPCFPSSSGTMAVDSRPGPPDPAAAWASAEAWYRGQPPLPRRPPLEPPEAAAAAAAVATRERNPSSTGYLALGTRETGVKLRPS
jgi:hypothetical protein